MCTGLVRPFGLKAEARLSPGYPVLLGSLGVPREGVDGTLTIAGRPPLLSVSRISRDCVDEALAITSVVINNLL